MSVQGDRFKAIADAIRAKKGTSDPIKASDFATEIASIEAGGETLGGEYNIEQIVDGDNCELVITTASGGGISAEELALYSDANIRLKTAVGVYAFSYDTLLSALTDGSLSGVVRKEDLGSITSFRKGAFEYTNITAIEIPNSVTSIGRYALSYADNLTDIYFYSNTPPTIDGTLTTSIIFHIPEGATATYQSAYGSGYTYIEDTYDYTPPQTEKTLFQACVDGSITEIAEGILGDITYIRGGAFDSCSNYTTFYMPDTVTEYGNSYSWSNPTALTYFKISNNLTAIKNYFLSNAINLPIITIPASVTSIGSRAFNNCSSLTTIVMEGTTPPTLANTNAISTATTAIYVPDESVSTYQGATNWSNFASIIKPISEREV